MPRYKSKKLRSNWSEDNLFQATESVRNGNSLRKAAEQFKVPRTTLSRRLLSPDVGKLPLGGKPTLYGMEADLVKHILEMEKSLFGLTARDVRKLAFQVKFVYRKQVESFCICLRVRYILACRKNWRST